MSPEALRTSFSADFYFQGMAFKIWVSKCLLSAPPLYPVSQTLSFNPRHISKSGSALQRPAHLMNPWIFHLEVSLQSGTDKFRRHMGSKSPRDSLQEQSVQLLQERTATINSRRSFLAAPGVQLFRWGWPKQIPSAFDMRHSSGTADILLGELWTPAYIFPDDGGEADCEMCLKAFPKEVESLLTGLANLGDFRTWKTIPLRCHFS